MFGPPQRFTIASTCSWLGHSVSGLRHDTLHPLQIRFRFGFVSLTLNLHHIVTRRPVLQKVRDYTLNRALSACKLTVSVSISLPSRGSFHLSLTVLFAIGHMVVFSLWGWSPFLPSGFLVSRRTLDTLYLLNHFDYKTFTSFGLLFQNSSSMIFLGLLESLPLTYCYIRFGLVRFRSPLLSESFLLSFPPGN